MRNVTRIIIFLTTDSCDLRDSRYPHVAFRHASDASNRVAYHVFRAKSSLNQELDKAGEKVVELILRAESAFREAEIPILVQRKIRSNMIAGHHIALLRLERRRNHPRERLR